MCSAKGPKYVDKIGLLLVVLPAGAYLKFPASTLIDGSSSESEPLVACGWILLYLAPQLSTAP